jgi:hypothetical protein
LFSGVGLKETGKVGSFARRQTISISVSTAMIPFASKARYPCGIIRGSTNGYNNGRILRIEVDVSKSGRRDEGIVFRIDTARVRYLEFYGKKYPVNEIPACR